MTQCPIGLADLGREDTLAGPVGAFVNGALNLQPVRPSAQATEGLWAEPNERIWTPNRYTLYSDYWPNSRNV